ncbi:MAG: tRNA (adenosine(37)-N6)-threonylcarbamoyltransferase complex transferase subunit TsaD [Deltaproteobacteria bacterium]|nr:tRNA (adenosine(37)-N6)-threonylcarbamoyltransferase complex transferase subunit TsaD [Deltaproteobacteria bacterium]
MLCLGIESSCDETALALVRDGRPAGQVLYSQADVHALFGGVVPELASREHGRFIVPLYELLAREHKFSPGDIDCIAVARGPGLLGSLLVGVAFAKSLALAWRKPVLGINHLHAHLLAAGLEGELKFPAVGLLVSGGHTHIYHIDSPARFSLLGRSIDDAAGEALDKFGKMLGLPYPAGKYIDRFAASGGSPMELFPKPYLDNDNCDFSFSGLKTAAATFLKSRPELRFQYDEANCLPVPPGGSAGLELAGICASYVHAVAETLRIKLARAIERIQKTAALASIILAGGVAASGTIRKTLGEMSLQTGLPLYIPSAALCTDNAYMVAYAGELLSGLGLAHSLSFTAVPRGAQVPDDYHAAFGYRAF